MNDAERPRLSPRCLARLHFVGGTCRVVLTDAETGEGVDVGPREWVVLSCLDGTRDLEGVALAAAREGVDVRREEIAALVASARDGGMIEDGALPRRRPAPAEARGASPSADRPIEHLPGYRFHCSGYGSCCRMYGSVVFSPLEAARARALLPEVLDAGARHEHAFTPERGAGPCPGSAVALVDGGCAYLDGSLCALHRAAGPASKPIGCNLFPLSLVDDGVRVRASVAVECSCVLESAGRAEGDPLLPPDVRSSRDLDPRYAVAALPARIAVTADRDAPLADYVRFSDAVLDAYPGGDGRDAAALAWALADEAEERGLERGHGGAPAIDEAPHVTRGAAAEVVAGIGARCARRAKAERGFRAERDLVRKGMLAIAAASELLADADVLGAVIAGAGARPGDESFYLRAVLFGHQLAGAPLSEGLRSRAASIWIARALPLAAEALFPGERDHAFDRPLALVEAILRGHGLRR